MTIDALAHLKTLVERAPFLAQWLEPMCAFLTQAAERTEVFCGDRDQGLGHLEADLQKPLAALKTQLLERAAQRKADQTPLQCPVCARKLTRRRKVQRTIHTLSGDIKVTRILGWCSKCKQWFCPGDEAMGVESGYSPAVQEAAALFASKMPLGEASKVIEHVWGSSCRPRPWTGWPSRPLRKRGKNAGRPMNKRAWATGISRAPSAPRIRWSS